MSDFYAALARLADRAGYTPHEKARLLGQAGAPSSSPSTRRVLEKPSRNSSGG